ncbi:Response regulator receiver modulated metal dependent phosphohydrolase [Methyloversatilis universalis FAM5]|uniref:Response regulator receiver modulated metal dependent phosphohydrolase n=1 Tax=Methyloversatilis universalis (strain ATCC BAA-1314 / DSM 25237 / JCM 13912 / CCUG 52030 / FAM5) TaxID=1000565 RepID=F5R7J0_METUF|nr:two-component system response regulator [Methyloversatilis universalis]EGK73469.1 Response regulator receiver modulated metal dependent phosphohydrolase [Methyloversatilis universalis FAM5]
MLNQAEPAAPRPPRQTVLVADDTPENIDLLSGLLRQDYRVKVATNGEKALAIINSDDPPDLILLDVMMPGMNGYDVCRRIKANPDRRGIPVIFVTAMTSIEDERLGLEVGAVDYITKPISPPIVCARVRTHLALYDQTRALEERVRERTAELLASRQQIIRRLGRAAEFRDNETGNHVIRMSYYARLIGEASGLEQAAAELLFNTASMHDIGKIGIPDAVLLKPGPLSTAEWAVMRRHPEIGAEIIGRHDDELLDTARTIALTHHERFDGSGYPHGLIGEAIPLFGRIVAIADVFDALMNKRPYKDAMAVKDTLQVMARSTGTHFDPRLVEAFRRALPDMLRIHDTYADTHGPMTDVDMPPEAARPSSGPAAEAATGADD